MIALADIGVAVTNAKAAAQWWKEKVGFAVHTLAGAEHAVLVAPPGDRFLLHLCEGFEPVSPGNTGIAFITDDLRAVVARMTAAGVVFTEPLAKDELGGSAKFADPDGNVFWLIGAPATFIRKTLNFKAPLASRKVAKKAAPKGPAARTKKAAPKAARGTSKKSTARRKARTGGTRARP